MAKKTVIIEVDAQTGQATQKLEEVDRSIDKVGKSTKNVKADTSAWGAAADKATGGLATGIKSGIGGIGKMVAAFKTLKGALISTGIGALIVLVGSLIAAFSRFQESNDKLSVGMSKVGVIVSKLADGLGSLGQIIIKAFEEPKQALDSFISGVEALWGWMQQLNTLIVGTLYKGLLSLKVGFLEAAQASAEFFGADETAAELQQSITETQAKIEEITKVTDAAADAVAQPFINAYNAVVDYLGVLGEVADAEGKLKQREIDLEKRQIKQIETQAKRNKLIAEYRLLSEDESKTIDERIENLEKALKLEEQTLNENLANAREQARIISERNALTESSREDLRKEAEAKAKVFELEEQSFKFQKRIFNELQTLRKQDEAEKQKVIDDELKRLQAQMEAQQEIEKAIFESQATQSEKEVAAIEEKYTKLMELAIQNGIDTAALYEAQYAELDAIEKKYAEESKKTSGEITSKQILDEKRLMDAKMNMAYATSAALKDIAEVLAGDNEKRARKAFALTKALNIAEAIANTYTSITTVLKDSTTPLPAKPYLIAASVATGLAAVAKIAATKFNAGGGSPGGGGVGSQLGGGDQRPTLTPNFSFLEQGANQNSIQAYVLESNVSNSQQANQKIKDQSVL